MAHLTKSTLLVALIVLTVIDTRVLSAQQKPLTNDDVIAMVHKKLPESVVLSAIQAGPAKFNTSPNELIRLNAAGVTEKELNAMLSASGKGDTASAPSNGTKSADSAAELPVSKSRVPRVAVTLGNS